jgi:CubicO group peptidase (beta-lactamase class C family)
MELGGSVEPGFEGVAEAFERNFAEGREDGAQCCVHVGGRAVVDLWAGYDEDALQVVFSSTKGATAACANLLVQRGLLDPDALVTDYWPEYGAAGKEPTLVRWVLSHQAGLPAPEPGLTMDDLGDWDKIVAGLAAQAPAWEPGTAYGYHAVTFGWLVGELVRRVDGRGLGQFFAEEVAGPAGADFWIGLPESEEHRVVPMVPNPMTPELLELFGPLFVPAMSMSGALGTGVELDRAANDRRFRAAEIGGGGGVASARGISRMYRWLLDAYTPETIARLSERQTFGLDRVLSMDVFPMEQQIGLGFMLSGPFTPMGGAASFGHSGAGGSYGFADPEHGIAFGYAMTKMLGDPGTDPRPNALVKATYDSFGLPMAFNNA